MPMIEVCVIVESEQVAAIKKLAAANKFQFTVDGHVCTLTDEAASMIKAKRSLSLMVGIADAMEAVILNQTMKKTIMDLEAGIKLPTREKSDKSESEETEE
jgi:enhancing lycopene biosynthesis protein 2